MSFRSSLAAVLTASLVACSAQQDAPDDEFYGGCRAEGERMSAKVGARCCEGSKPMELREKADADGQCHATAPPDLKVCTRCGDGHCGLAENACNCAQDCG